MVSGKYGDQDSERNADIAAILELRRHGATRARSGAMEAEWQAPPLLEASPNDIRVPATNTTETEPERKQRLDRELFHSSGG